MQTELINVWINGEHREVGARQSVAALLRELKIASDRVAVELNESIVRSRDWDKVTVPSGARIEIVQFVGGG